MSLPTSDWNGHVRLRGQKVYVSVAGQGRPLLLINGLGGSVALWSSVRRSLPDTRVICFDAPGAGDSPAPWVPTSIGRLASLADDLLDHLDEDQVDVLGYSLGGLVAQQFARRSRSRVRRLVLAATTCGWGLVPGSLGSALAIITPLRYYSKTAYRLTTPLLAGNGVEASSEFIERTATDRLATPPSVCGYYQQLSAAWRWTSLPWLNELDQPTLIITGAEDRLVPLANSKLLASRMPKARLIVLEDRGHFLLWDPTSGAADLISDFLQPELDGSKAWREARRVKREEAAAAIRHTKRGVEPARTAHTLARRLLGHGSRENREVAP